MGGTPTEPHQCSRVYDAAMPCPCCLGINISPTRSSRRRRFHIHCAAIRCSRILTKPNSPERLLFCKCTFQLCVDCSISLRCSVAVAFGNPRFCSLHTGKTIRQRMKTEPSLFSLGIGKHILPRSDNQMLQQGGHINRPYRAV